MPQSQKFSWKNSRILIADDEPDMREIFSAWFRNLGCTVTEAADGKEALDALGRCGISLDVTHYNASEAIIGSSLSVGEETLTHLAGWGCLRWSENSPHSSRIGIEFLHLDDESLLQLARWLKDPSPVSF